MSGEKRVVLGFLTFGAGMLAGAAVALLYTPMTGKRFRRTLADAAEDVFETAQDVRSEVKRAVGM